MSYCACGNEAEPNGTQCASCAALQCLDLRLGATKQEIEKAFEMLSIVWQPDRFTNDPKTKAIAEDKLATIQSAYQYLMSHAALPGAFRASMVHAQAGAPAATPVETEMPAPRMGEPVQLNQKADAPWRIALPPQIVMGCGMVVAGLVTLWFVYKPMDAALLANPATSGWYREYKASLSAMFSSAKGRIGDQVGSIAERPAAPVSPNSSGAEVATKPEAAAGTRTAAQHATPATRVAVAQPGEAAPGEVHHLTPLITTGMSKSELIAAAGDPTATTADTLAYGSSEFYFRNDSLIGWKIDGAAPMRVKLWPEGSVNPDVTSFTVGSTKNEVIAIQGTPTYLSADKFGYGASEVYFVSNRVVGWKNDASTPLRIGSR